MSAVSFVIGNHYNETGLRESLGNPGHYSCQAHSYAMYVDFFDGDVDLVQKVTFQIMGSRRRQTLHCPFKLTGSYGWRFQAGRNKAFERNRTVLVTIIGRGRSIIQRHYRVRLAPGGKESRIMTFYERRSNQPLKPVAMPNHDFGIELELSTSTNTSTRDVAQLIREKARVNVEDIMGNYALASSRNDVWVLMADSSLVCSKDNPVCNRFELKSPILRGGNGLHEVDRVMRALEEIHSSINVNHSMGFHVHVNISKLSKFGLTNVCQNFVKFERVMDSLMPPSRKDCNGYCQSNRLAVGATEGYSRDMGKVLAYCESKETLAETMCPNDRYYKLNMRPFLEKGKSYKPTIEFRQHSASYNNVKIKNWIRFCMSFVHNSAGGRPPPPLREKVDERELFEMLMMRVVKDRFLRDYYRQRQFKFLDDEIGDCCEGCDVGDGCEVRNLKWK